MATYRGIITKLTAQGAWVEIPELTPKWSYGPCEVVLGEYSIDDQVVCVSMSHTKDDVVIIGKVTLDAQETIIDGNDSGEGFIGPFVPGRMDFYPEDYGAKADGVTDDTVAINKALAAAAGHRLVFASHTYKITDTLTISAGTKIDMRGATIDGTSIPVGTSLNQRIAFKIDGVVDTTTQAISNAIAQWSIVITGIASTAGFTAGDLVIIRNLEQVVPGINDPAVANHWCKGELNQIVSVDSGTQITVRAGALFSYGTTGLTVQKMTPAADVSITGGTIKLGGVGTAHNAIRASNVLRLRIRDLTISGAEDEAIALSNAFDAVVEGCHITDCTSPEYLGKSTGYGVAVLEGSRFVRVKSNYFRNCRHCVSGGGTIAPAFIDILDNYGQWSLATTFECHEPGHHWTFRGNTSVGSQARGIQYRGQYGTIDNNTVIDSGSDGINFHAYDDVTEQHGARITNNTVRGCNVGIALDATNDTSGDPNGNEIDVLIANNQVFDSTLSGITVKGFSNAKVSSNLIHNAGLHGIICLGLDSSTKAFNLTVADNEVIQETGGSGIDLTDVTGLTLTGNRVKYANTAGYLLTRCADVDITGCNSKSAVNYGISLVTCTSVTITGGSFVDATTSGNGHGIRGTGSTDVTVMNTFTRNPGRGIYLTTTDQVIITGNNVRNNSSSVKASADDATTGKFIAGNLGMAGPLVVSGAKGSNAALGSLLADLVSLGLITDSTTT